MDDSSKHIEGSKCPECCCHQHRHEDCGGYWHMRVIDDTIEDGFIHNFKCDTCSLEEYHFGYEDMPIEFKVR